MPKINKTTIMTAIGVAIGGVIYASFIAPTVNKTISKVA